jgi:hypothetical protein
MNNRFIVLGALLNLVTLLIGLSMGFFLGTSYSGHVYAQQLKQQVKQQVEEIVPGVTAPSFAAAVILGHEINADSMVVRGYDLLKLHQNTLNFLGDMYPLNRAQIQQIIETSLADKVYHMKSPEQPKPKEGEKK